MGPSEAVLLIVTCGVTICAINQVILRDKLDTSRLVPFLAGGVLGGFAGLSGVLPTIWSGLRAWPKARQRGTYQPYLLTMHGLALVPSPSPVSVDVKMGERHLWCPPALLVGTWVGLKLYGHLNEV